MQQLPTIKAKQYVVIDLEFIPNYDKKSNSAYEEIIQIGAVKLNNNYEIIDTYNEVVKPYQIVRSRYLSLTGISKAEIEKARHLDDGVLEDFFSWAGNECVFIQWSDADKLALKRNARSLGISIPFHKKHFYNIQKTYQLVHNFKTLPSLSAAILKEGLEFEGSVHNAFYDATNTAKIFKTLYQN